MTNRIIGYQEGNSWIHRLSGASKLLFFILVTSATMISYDTRLLAGIAVFSLLLFLLSGIRLREISFVLNFALFLAVLNVLTVYLFAPQYGTEIYGSRTILLEGWGNYNLTSQEIFYLINLALKYICTIPLAVVFLMTTHPSQFAASLNQIGVPYRIAYSVSLTLRYIPDVQEEFQTIKMAQAARGLELSKKASFMQRIKGNLQMILPLIFSSLNRIETIATAMELRRFGKNKKRTWYRHQAFEKMDYGVVTFAFLVVLLSLGLIVVNGGRFYNPWR